MKQTKYQMISDEIKQQIIEGKYKIGETIPTELALQAQYGVSRHTVRQAIGLLSTEGYLRTEKGSGTYVLDFQLKPSNMKDGQNKTIGVMTTYISNYIFPDIIHGIEKALREKGYSLLLSSTNNDVDQEIECLKMMLDRHVEGLIVEPTKSNEFNPNLPYYIQLKENNVPIVMINACYEELSAPYVVMNDVKAGQILTDYLIDKGHTNIGIITKIDDLQGKYRLKGFLKSCEKNKISVAPEQICTYKTGTEEQALHQLKQMIDHGETNSKLSAIICYNDEMASQVIEALKQENKAVPNDISVVGYDDSILSVAGDTEITTISHAKEQMGIDAVATLLKMLSGNNQIENIIYEPQIIERASVFKR